MALTGAELSFCLSLAELSDDEKAVTGDTIFDKCAALVQYVPEISRSQEKDTTKCQRCKVSFLRL